MSPSGDVSIWATWVYVWIFFFIESKLSRLLLCYELTLAANTGRESTLLKHLNSNSSIPTDRVYSCHWFIPVFSKHVLGVTHLVILRADVLSDIFFSFSLRDFPNVCYVESFQRKYKSAFFFFLKIHSFIVTGWGLLFSAQMSQLFCLQYSNSCC